MKKSVLEKHYNDESNNIDTSVENMGSIIRKRNSDVSCITKQIHEIHEIYTELEALVECQGTVIDKISDNIETTKTTTNEGVKQLIKAERINHRCNIL